MTTYIDILKGASLVPSLPESGAVSPVPSPVPPLDSNPVMERFRRVTHNMQNIARDSIKQEIERIIALPIITYPSDEEIATVSNYYCPDGIITLYPEQVKAMMEYHDCGGLVAPVPVGGGKTLISVLIANDAFLFFGKRKILLMNPPNLIDQLANTELPFYRRHISINIPFYWIAGQDAGKRMKLAKSKRAGCYVVSYSLLSGRHGAELIDAIEPDLIIGDEIHKIASASSSARGRRFKEAITKYNPQLVGLSGTITKKSPRDYHHLAVHALHESCFMPRPTSIADDWASIIDSNASSIDDLANNTNFQPGPIKPLMVWARKNFPEEKTKQGKTKYPNNLIGFRAAFQKRMETCPGVVASNGDELGIALRISNIKISTKEKESSQGWSELERLVTQLTTLWIAPNGDEIDHAMHMWRWRYELEGFGFYNNLFWPTAEKVATRKKITVPQAQDIVERSVEHHILQQEYHRVLRGWIKRRAVKGLDTPFLIGGDMSRHGDAHVGSALFNAWDAMKQAVFANMIERDRAVVRVCDFRIKKIVEWAKQWHKKRPEKAAIIWYMNNGVAEWLKDEFIAAGLPMLYCPSGKKGLANLEDRTQGDKFAIASLEAYKEGLNLQYHHDTEMFAQWPRPAIHAQQGMGRVHRNEQPADEVRIFYSICSDFDEVNFAACLNDAAYIHQTAQKQKLLYADYDERPKVLPHSVLMEWGTQVKQLNISGQVLLEDRFKGG